MILSANFNIAVKKFSKLSNCAIRFSPSVSRDLLYKVLPSYVGLQLPNSFEKEQTAKVPPKPINEKMAAHSLHHEMCPLW